MKNGIHPNRSQTNIVCGTCGTVWPTISTREGIRVDICANCHPFYTGEQRIVDTAGQVDRFMRRLQQAEAARTEAAKRRDERSKPAPKKPSLLQELYGDEES
jgi:large subunit ribosomal protein L31